MKERAIDLVTVDIELACSVDLPAGTMRPLGLSFTYITVSTPMREAADNIIATKQ